MREIRRISLYFQFDTAAGASNSFRIGGPNASYTLNVATDFARVYDNFALIQLPTAELIPTGSGTVVSNRGMGFLRANQGDPDEFVYTVEESNYFTQGGVRTLLVRVGTTSSSAVDFYPPI